MKTQIRFSASARRSKASWAILIAVTVLALLSLAFALQEALTYNRHKAEFNAPPPTVHR